MPGLLAALSEDGLSNLARNGHAPPVPGKTLRRVYGWNTIPAGGPFKPGVGLSGGVPAVSKTVPPLVRVFLPFIRIRSPLVRESGMHTGGNCPTPKMSLSKLLEPFQSRWHRARLSWNSPPLKPKAGLNESPTQKFLPYSGVIIDIEDWLHLFMFNNLSDAVYRDYVKGWIARRKSLRRIFQIERPGAFLLAP
jgi:hypothetical protein